MELRAMAVKRIGILLGLAGGLALSACGRDEAVLPGERENIRDVITDEAEQAPVEGGEEAGPTPLSLPGTEANSEWLQRITSPDTRTSHPALSASPQLAWSVSVGAGNSKSNRITADPVVAGGRVFTLDSEAQVAAVSTGGKVQWTRDLVPPGDSGSQASGGGLAYGDGKLFVSSGFGLMTALDPQTGDVIWQQKLRATGSGSPAYRDGLVYLVAGDDVAWALDADDGRIRWQLSATPDIHNVMGGPAPAVTGKYVVFAFGSGELQGALRKGGLRLWDTLIAGQRQGYSSARVGDITGDPVVVGDRVYVGSHSGRTVALKLGNGERLWTAGDGPLSPIWPAGDSLFMISDRNELLRLNAEDGRRIWSEKLPFFTKSRPRRQSEIFGHYGPIIAGGQLIVASNDGVMRFYDPASGDLRNHIEMPDGAASNPVVAGRTLYVVSGKGQLLAFR